MTKEETLKSNAVKALWKEGYHPRQIAVALTIPIGFVRTITDMERLKK